jgi:hypothetical protein
VRFTVLVLASLLSLSGLRSDPVRADSVWPSRSSFPVATTPALPVERTQPRVRRASFQKAPTKRPARQTRSSRLATARAAARSKREGRVEGILKKAGRRVVNLPPSVGPWAWSVRKAAWSADDEKGFEEFVRRIGESECATVHECLTSPLANPRFFDKHPPRTRFFADCADLPFALRAYFAWQNGLPFSFSTYLASHPRTPGHTSRLSGNKVTARYDIVGPGPDARAALTAINNMVNTEHFRIPSTYAGTVLPDHYPVRISRESIRAGTVIFDPDGHLAIVYKVTDDGRVFYIDAHPDNSLTRGLFNREFSRAEPPMGAGFKRWRPQRLVGAKPGKNGTLVGGRIELARDAELPDWSDEQFFGTETPRPAHWKDGRFLRGGQEMEFHDYVRVTLAHEGFKYDPLDETRTMVRQLCRDLHYRVQSVDLAIRSGIHRRPAPDRLPNNIYATQGDWEVYSTPSRDARIKTAFEELRDEIDRFLELDRTNSTILDYTGGNLRRDLLALYDEETAACSITYTKSDGTPKKLSYATIEKRLFELSFDPYHCVERRWGETDPAELTACVEDPIKARWYKAQQRLRQQLTRTYGEKMGWTLAEVENPKLDIGIDERPDVDARSLLTMVASASVDAGKARATDGAQIERPAAAPTVRVRGRAARQPARGNRGRRR